MKKAKKIYNNNREEEWERRWEEKYLLLEEHKKIFGHLKLVDIYDTWEHTLKFKKLNQWAGTQRERAVKGTLKLHRYNLLINIGFSFNLDLDLWLKQYDLLLQFKNKYGTCRINCNKYPEMASLYNWTRNQIQNKDSLTLFQKTRLDELGFNWESKDEAWSRNVDALKKFKKKYGHCNVPRIFYPEKHPPEFKRLIRFIRYIYERYSKGKLKEKYLLELNELGLEFYRKNRKWERFLSKLIEYKSKYGNCNVPQTWKEDIRLAVWVRKQREKKNIMPEDRIKILDSIGFDWNPLETSFMQKYNYLKEFKEKHGNLKLSRKENEAVFLWMGNLRQSKRGRGNIKLTDEQIKMLNDLGFDWEPVMTEWNKKYNLLLEYVREQDSFFINRSESDKKALKVWVNGQRRDKYKLSEEQIKRLDDVGFDWVQNNTKGKEFRILKD